MKQKKIRAIIISVLFGIVAFLAVGLLVTETLQKVIYFSMFLGIPLGIVAGIMIFMITYSKMS